MYSVLYVLDEKRFALITPEPVSALALTGLGPYPEMFGIRTTDSAGYERFCRDMDTLRTVLRLRDLTEVEFVLLYFWKQTGADQGPTLVG